MASIFGPPAKRLRIMGSTNVIKTVRFEAPTDIISGIKDTQSFNKILEMLRTGDTDNKTLVSWFKQLEDNIIVLNDLPPKERSQIVNIIVKANWVWSKVEEVVNCYCSLIECMVSFNVDSTLTVIVPLVMLLYPKSLEADVVDVGIPSEEDKQQFDAVHKLLAAIVRITPMAGQLLFNVLKEKFPHELFDHHKQACYIINVLHVTYYLTEFRRELLGLIIGRIKTVDLECPWSEIHEAERTSICESVPEDFTMTDLVFTKMNHKMANFLDVLMKEMFLYINKNCRTGDVVDGNKTKKLYKELLTEFDKNMILSSGTCHVQFLMFYMCRYHLKLCRGFIDYLWKKVTNVKLPVEVRQSAVSFIGSFIVRHATVPISTVRDCLLLMKNWIHYYIDKHGGSPSQQKENHDTFYAVCQAMFYVLTCRIEELTKMPDGQHFLFTLHLSSVVSSQLCPLKYCTPSIAQLFASKAKDYQLAYCYTYMIDDGDETDAPAPSLKSSFPFDPCLLVRSSEFVDPIYRVFMEQFYGFSEKEEEPVSEDEAIDALFDDNSTTDSLHSLMFD
ncbi:DNA independent RNA polymerase I transcription factor [Chamberlinius hualienensis]